MKPIYLFAYGSLKSGFHNHDVLSTSKFIKTTTTIDDNFLMCDLGKFPAVIENGNCKVAGELYQISENTLKYCDYLEGNGSLYQRKLVKLQGFDAAAWMYILLPGYIDDIENIGDLSATSNIKIVGDAVVWT